MIAADRAARLLITVGGIGTILAVVGVFVFLVWVVVPLFAPAEIGSPTAVGSTPGAATASGPSEVLHLAVDEYRLLGGSFDSSGRLRVFRLDDGSTRRDEALFAPGEVTAASFLLRGDLVVFGLADGGLQLASLGFESERLTPDELPDDVRDAVAAAARAPIDFRDGVVQETGPGQLRFQHLVVSLGERIQVSTGPVRLVHHADLTTGPLVVALAAGEEGDRLLAVSGSKKSNFLTGAKTVVFSDPVELPFEPVGAGVPSFLIVTGSGADVYLAWEDGTLVRVASRDLGEAYLAETGSLVEPGERLATMTTALGGETLVWGDSRGRVRAGFPVRVAERDVDAGGGGLRGGYRTERAPAAFRITKELHPAGPAAATVLAASARSRLVVAGFSDGETRVLQVSNETELARASLTAGEAIADLALAPKEDLLLVRAGDRLLRADLDPKAAEASFRGFFRPIWYEGYPAPEHVWQSSSGTDDFEIKLGLVPLIFGTLKATFYSMLFGAPLALLAAIFTSEVLHPRAKAVVKPTIELMASLPSVVLGFLAALVFAPLLEDVVPATLAAFVTLPLSLLSGAALWQLLPHDWTRRFAAWRFALLTLALPVAIAAAAWLGPSVERGLFGGDVKGWLAWEPGPTAPEAFRSSVGGWLFLTLPLAAAVAVFVSTRFLTPGLRTLGADWSRFRLAVADAGKLVVVSGVALGFALAVASLLDTLGFDPRGGFLDTYVQRNSLVVGFVMGFAIIPIIYTLSEDALQAVPESLRSASLGAGATPWQTAMRIVVPTAMSGLFSAVMVGLGRAVGETMIVLMAAGNTPVLSWNVFEGFRTLSANIAVELPEAVKDSVHYRTLFLAALVLFAMTFVVNTIAERVRLRFRKRAYQL